MKENMLNIRLTLVALLFAEALIVTAHVGAQQDLPCPASLFPSPNGLTMGCAPPPTPGPISTTTATETPAESAQTPLPSPTMYPTPVIDLSKWIRREAGPVLTVSLKDGVQGAFSAAKGTTAFNKAMAKRAAVKAANAGSDDLAPLIQAASDELDVQGGGSIRVIGPKGDPRVNNQNAPKIRTRPIVAHYLVFDGEFYCDQRDINWGCIILRDGVTVEGVNGAIIHESRFHAPEAGAPRPAITIIQPYEDFSSVSHEKQSHNITVTGLYFKGGEQTASDGGTRSTVMVSNCDTCAVFNNTFDAVRSIGVNWGGSVQSGNYARNFLSYNNKHIRYAGAAEAVVNGDHGIIMLIDCSEPGMVGFPGAPNCVDQEPNVKADHAAFNWYDHITCDHRKSELAYAGNCIAIQNPEGSALVHDNLVTNSYADGGNPSDPSSRHLSNGLIISRQHNFRAYNFGARKAGQSCIQIDGGDALLQDIRCNACGGGGNAAILLGGGQHWFHRVQGARLSRILLFNEPGTAISTENDIRDCGSGTVIQESLVKIVTSGCS